MTMPATTPRISYLGDGVTVAFPVPFKFFGSDELEVIEKVLASGAETTRILTTDYTVAGGGGATGTVTANTAPAAGTVSWTIARKTKQTQEVDYTPGDNFPAETHERALDRLTALVQELSDKLSRAAVLSATTALTALPLPDPVANQFLGWKSDASGLENKNAPAGATIYASIANTRLFAATSEAVTPRGLHAALNAGAALVSANAIAKPADANLGGAYTQSGNTTVNSYWAGSVDGEQMEIRYTGTPQLTIAGNLLPPNGAAFNVTAGDTLTWRWDASVSKWRCWNGMHADGSALTAAAVVVRKPVPRRQVVLQGPVTAAGLPNFGGVTGAASVTAAGTIVATAAAGADKDGAIDRVGSITNPQWTGLNVNGTMYLLLRVNADGTCTPVVTSVLPVDQFGGTPANTNGLLTFNIQEMVGYYGNGSAAPQDYLVKVGEVTVAGNVVTAITWYGVMGRYHSAFTATLPTTAVAINQDHNLGTDLILGAPALILKCTTADANFAVGDLVHYPTQNTSGGEWGTVQLWRTSKKVGFTTATTSAFRLNSKTTGAGTGLTAGSWAYALAIDRDW